MSNEELKCENHLISLYKCFNFNMKNLTIEILKFKVWVKIYKI